jgi:hypothetical protein
VVRRATSARNWVDKAIPSMRWAVMLFLQREGGKRGFFERRGREGFAKCAEKKYQKIPKNIKIKDKTSREFMDLASYFLYFLYFLVFLLSIFFCELCETSAPSAFKNS